MTIKQAIRTLNGNHLSSAGSWRLGTYNRNDSRESDWPCDHPRF